MKEIIFLGGIIMKIFKKEISKKQVKVFIGGIALAVVGTITAVVIHNKDKDEVIEDVYYVETENTESNEIETSREEA
jgi:hypothetical protein